MTVSFTDEVLEEVKSKFPSVRLLCENPDLFVRKMVEVDPETLVPLLIAVFSNKRKPGRRRVLRPDVVMPEGRELLEKVEAANNSVSKP